MAEGREGGGRERGRGRGDELFDRLVSVNRVSKVVKGGRRFNFAALVVVGDRKGRVGHGHGKAREISEAVRKASEEAKRGMLRVPLREGRTLHHDVTGRSGAGKVVLRAAPAGTGIIAGGAMRAVFETLGAQDMVAKSLGSRNPHNMVRATFNALSRASSPRLVAERRGKSLGEINAARGHTDDKTDEKAEEEAVKEATAKKVKAKGAEKAKEKGDPTKAKGSPGKAKESTAKEKESAEKGDAKESPTKAKGSAEKKDG